MEERLFVINSAISMEFLRGLPFCGAACDALHVVTLEEDEQQHNGNSHENGARGKTGEHGGFMGRVEELEEPYRHGVLLPVCAEDDLREDEVGPRRDERHERGVDDNGLTQRHNDLPEDLP